MPREPPARVQMAQGSEQRWALTAVEGAARRRRCQQVLSDFTGTNGLTLEGLASRECRPSTICGYLVPQRRRPAAL